MDEHTGTLQERFATTASEAIVAIGTHSDRVHQAMAEQDSEMHPPGTVMQAWTAGWTLHGRLLKPAMVVVAKAPTAELPGSGRRR